MKKRKPPAKPANQNDEKSSGMRTSPNPSPSVLLSEGNATKRAPPKPPTTQEVDTSEIDEDIRKTISTIQEDQRPKSYFHFRILYFTCLVGFILLLLFLPDPWIEINQGRSSGDAPIPFVFSKCYDAQLEYCEFEFYEDSAQLQIKHRKLSLLSATYSHCAKSQLISQHEVRFEQCSFSSYANDDLLLLQLENKDSRLQHQLEVKLRKALELTGVYYHLNRILPQSLKIDHANNFS